METLLSFQETPSHLIEDTYLVDLRLTLCRRSNCRPSHKSIDHGLRGRSDVGLRGVHYRRRC